MKVTKKIFGISILPLILLICGAISNIYFEYSSIKTTKEYLNNSVERQNLLYEIHRNIGYGGGIHAFKNYVLRFDQKYKDAAEKLFKKAEDKIQLYLGLKEISVEEENGMKILLETIKKYQSMIPIVSKMVTENKTQMEIDHAVKVDDGPALKAMETLQTYYLVMKNSKLLALENAQDLAINMMLLIFVSSIVLSLILSSLFSKQILTSVTKLVEISNQITFGKYNLKNDISDLSDDEFKSLAYRMIGMGKSLDITIQKLKTSNEDLKNYAFIASHDLQEPMKKIFTYAELLDLELGDLHNENSRNYIHNILTSSERMIHLIKALLNFSKVTSRAIEFGTVDLEEVVKDVLSDVELDININHMNIIIEGLPKVVGNKELLHIVVKNLISNAIKYRNKLIESKIEVMSENIDQGTIKFIVRDNGIGFNMKDIDIILRPFGRLDSVESYAGSGIGLSLCKRIIEAHGSQIEIESELGVGSTFGFKLPLT